MEEYKKKVPLDQRRKEVTMLLRKYPNRIPLYVDAPKKDIKIQKNKYLVEDDVSIGSVYMILRKMIDIKQNEGIYLMINKTLVPTSQDLKTIYDQYKDEDGLLYIQILKEETFGYLKN